MENQVSFFYTVTTYKEKSGRELQPQKRIYKLEDLLENVYQVVRLDPNIVLVDIVSNDIASMDACAMWRQEIRDMVGLCIQFAQNFRPEQTVVFLQVAPRLKTTGKGMTPEIFEQYAKYFNDMMFVRQGDAIKGGGVKRDDTVAPTNLRTQKLQGFRNLDTSAAGGARQYKTKPLDEMLSSDRIHPTLDIFRNKYRNIIHKAITSPRNRPANM